MKKFMWSGIFLFLLLLIIGGLNLTAKNMHALLPSAPEQVIHFNITKEGWRFSLFEKEKQGIWPTF